MKNISDIGKGIQTFGKDQPHAIATESLSGLADADSQDALTVTADAVGGGGGGGCSQCIEVRIADPTGADLYEGRIWVIE